MSDKPTAGASWYDEEMQQLRSQLAAEREKAKRVPPPVDNKFVAEGCAQFGELPAKTEAVFIMNRSLMLENEQLRLQLAMLVNALKKVANGLRGNIGQDCQSAVTYIDTVLGKVGK